MPVVVILAVRLRPRPQCPGEKEEASASCKIAERRQQDGNPVCDRRREVDQTLHNRDCRNAGFKASSESALRPFLVGLLETAGHWMLPCSVVTTQAVPRCPIYVILPEPGTVSPTST